MFSVSLRRMLQRLLLQLGDFQRQLVQRRLVVVHDRIQQRVGDAVRARGRCASWLLTARSSVERHAAERRRVVGDEKILAEKEIQLARGEHAVLAAVIHRVDHHEQIRRELVLLLGRILLHLRRRADRHAVLDGQRVEMEHVLQHILGLLRRRVLQVHPEEQVRVAQQRRHQEHLDVLAVQPALSCKYQRANHSLPSSALARCRVILSHMLGPESGMASSPLRDQKKISSSPVRLDKDVGHELSGC